MILIAKIAVGGIAAIFALSARNGGDMVREVLPQKTGGTD
jgi:hypothetical protein